MGKNLRRREMTRRGFLAFGAVALAPRAAQCSTAVSMWPATLDLREPVRRSVQCMIHRMDPAENFRPWFAVDVEDWTPVRLRHDAWDFGDTGGRFLEALILARQMVAPTSEMLLYEEQSRGFVSSLFGPEGLVENLETQRVDHMFAQGSTLYALVTDYDANPSPELAERIQAFIQALDRHARHAADYLWFPEVATGIAPCSHQAAYQVLPAVRFYELTHYGPALNYAAGLGRWAFYHDPTVTADGVITRTGWEGHLHAWMDTFSGIIRCVRAGGSLNRNTVVARSCRLLEWVKRNYTSPFGWVADSVGSKTCETDTITSFIRLALELIKEGHGEYWNDIERFVRNQLVENQFRDVRDLHIRDERTAQGLKGAFESYAHPNTLIALKKGTIEGCCINGGVRGLFLAYQNAIHESPDEIRINLLWTGATPGVEVVSYAPHEGRLDLRPTSRRPLLVRCPDWLLPRSVRIEGVNSVTSVHVGGSNYLRIADAKSGSRITLRFDQPEVEKEYRVAGITYKVRWRGDTVTELKPAGKPYPIFARASLSPGKTPFEPWNTDFPQPRVHW